MKDSEIDVEQLNKMVQSARSNWLSLLAVLGFVGVTLLSIEHSDFYGIDREAELPFLSIGVPINNFFYLSSILIAATICYFHIYQLRIWILLGHIRSTLFFGVRLSDAIHPWLLTESALVLRDWRRGPGAASKNSLTWLSLILAFSLSWLFGPLVLMYLWIVSFAARDTLLNGTVAASFFLSVAVSFISALEMWKSMSGKTKVVRSIWNRLPIYLMSSLSLILFMFFYVYSLERVKDVGWLDQTNLPILPERFFGVAPIDLSDEAISEKPEGWISRRLAERDFLDIWCRREGISKCKQHSNAKEFQQEWKERRRELVRQLRKPRNSQKYDLRHANLNRAFFAGIDFSGVNFEGSYFDDAVFERARLSGAKIIGTLEPHNRLVAHNVNFDAAWLDRATVIFGDISDLSKFEQTFLIQFVGTSFHGANMSDAAIGEPSSSIKQGGWPTQMSRADFSSARMTRAALFGNFRRANFSNADLFGATLNGRFHLTVFDGANFDRLTSFGSTVGPRDPLRRTVTCPGAKEEGGEMDAKSYPAILNSSRIVGARFKRTTFCKALLNYAMLSGTAEDEVTFDDDVYVDVQGDGLQLRFIDFEHAAFEQGANLFNAFGDGSVAVPEHALSAFGSRCHWPENPNNDDEIYYSHYRGWLSLNGSSPDWQSLVDIDLVPEKFADVEPVSPPDGCAWTIVESALSD